MNQELIFLPFLAMVILTMLVWVYMYARRIAFISGNNLNPDELKGDGLEKLSPEAVSNPSENFKNLFEMPVLFYVVSVYLYVTENVDFTYLVGCWVFVGFRYLHSIVHCTFNKIMIRFWLYFLSSISLWFVIVRCVMGVL